MLQRASLIPLLLRVERITAAEVGTDAAVGGELLTVLGIEPHRPQGAALTRRVFAASTKSTLIGVPTSSVLTSSATVIHRFFIGFLSAGEKKANTSGIGAGAWAGLELKHPTFCGSLSAHGSR